MKKNLSEITILHDCCTLIGGLGSQIDRSYENFFASQDCNKDFETRATVISYGGSYDILFENQLLADIKIGKFKTFESGEHPIIDSIAGGINDLGQRYSNTDTSLHPENVIFVIIAVGKDNASRHFTYRDLYTIIKHQSDVYSWRFYLLTEDSALSKQLGISDENTILLDTDNERFFENGFNDLNERISKYRGL